MMKQQNMTLVAVGVALIIMSLIIDVGALV